MNNKKSLAKRDSPTQDEEQYNVLYIRNLLKLGKEEVEVGSVGGEDGITN